MHNKKIEDSSIQTISKRYQYMFTRDHSNREVYITFHWDMAKYRSKLVRGISTNKKGKDRPPSLGTNPFNPQVMLVSQRGILLMNTNLMSRSTTHDYVNSFHKKQVEYPHSYGYSSDGCNNKDAIPFQGRLLK